MDYCFTSTQPKVGGFSIHTLDNSEELDKEQSGNDVSDDGNVLELTAEDLDHSVGDQTQTNGMTDGAGNRHADPSVSKYVLIDSLRAISSSIISILVSIIPKSSNIYY